MKTFFRTYRDHFWLFALLNLITFLLTLPLLLIVYLCVNAAFGIVANEAVVDILPGLGFYMSLFSASGRAGEILVRVLIAVSALLYGPLKFTVTDIHIRLYDGSFHFFRDVLRDLRRKLLQAELIGLLDLLILGRLIANLTVGTSAHSEWLHSVVVLVSVIALLAWIQVRRYLFQLSAAGEFRLPAILKNSIIFSISDLRCNSKCTLFGALVWGVTLLTIPLLTVIVLPLFSYSFNGYIATSCIYPVLKSKIFRPQ